MKFSSEPPTAALFFVREIEDVEIEIFERDQKFRSRSKNSIGIKFFLIVGALREGQILLMRLLVYWFFFPALTLKLEHHACRAPDRASLCSCISVISGMARVRLADLNGPKWTSLNQNEPKWTILVRFSLANAKIQFGIRTKMDQNGRLDHFGPFWSSTLSNSAAASP